MDNSVLTRLRNELITFAKMNRKVDYLTCSLVIGHQQIEVEEVDEILKKIAKEDHAEGRPLLWAIVPAEGSTLPTKAYFDTLASLGIVEKSDQLNEAQIHARQVQEVFNHWSRRRKTGRKW